MALKIFNESQVEQIFHDVYDQEAVLDAVENIFIEYLDGDAGMVPKIYLDIGVGDDYRAMPAFNKKYACMKWIADYTSNRTKGFPTTQAIIILNDKNTGFPLAIIEGNHITRLRTAAATALATRELVKDKKIEKISFIGCGEQTAPHIHFILNVLSQVEEISVYDSCKEKAELLAKSFITPKTVVANSLEECVANSRVVTTLTPSMEPYLFRSMLPEICHINAVGADAVGKRELGDDIFRSKHHKDNGDGTFETTPTRVVCDDYDQANHSGEMQYLKAENAYDPNGGSVMSLGHLLRNIEQFGSSLIGKRDVSGLTVYDSTGLAIEDLALAQYVFENSVNVLDEKKTI